PEVQIRDVRPPLEVHLEDEGLLKGERVRERPAIQELPEVGEVPPALEVLRYFLVEERGRHGGADRRRPQTRGQVEARDEREWGVAREVLRRDVDAAPDTRPPGPARRIFAGDVALEPGPVDCDVIQPRP